VLRDEVEGAEGCDEGARHREHERHAEEQHHPGVLLAESELVPDRLLKYFKDVKFEGLFTQETPFCPISFL